MKRYCALTVSIITLIILSPFSAFADLVGAADLFEAEGTALDGFAADIAANLFDIETAIAGLGGGYSISGLGSIGGDLFDAGDELRLNDLFAVADLVEAEGTALDGFAADIAANLFDIETAIAGLGGGYSISGLGSIGGDLFDAGDELRLNDLFAVADLVEAEGTALDGFAADIAANLFDIETAIAGLGGGYSISGLGSIGGDLFDAGDELRSVPEPSGAVFLTCLPVFALCITSRCTRNRRKHVF